jgi:hypothetical protein
MFIKIYAGPFNERSWGAQIRRLETIGEALIDRRQSPPCLVVTPLESPQPGKAESNAQLPKQCVPLSRNPQRLH